MIIIITSALRIFILRIHADLIEAVVLKIIRSTFTSESMGNESQIDLFSLI